MFPLQLWRQQLLICDQSNHCVMTSHKHSGFNITHTHTHFLLMCQDLSLHSVCVLLLITSVILLIKLRSSQVFSCWHRVFGNPFMAKQHWTMQRRRIFNFPTTTTTTTTLKVPMEKLVVVGQWFLNPLGTTIIKGLIWNWRFVQVPTS